MSREIPRRKNKLCNHKNIRIKEFEFELINLIKKFKILQFNFVLVLTWSELEIAKIYWKTMVCELKLKNPKIHVTPKIGNRIKEERKPVLKVRKKIIDVMMTP